MPAGILVIWIIADNAPPADDLSVASNDVALRQARFVPAVHPLIVADEVYWINQFHHSSLSSITLQRKSSETVHGVRHLRPIVDIFDSGSEGPVRGK